MFIPPEIQLKTPTLLNNSAPGLIPKPVSPLCSFFPVLTVIRYNRGKKGLRRKRHDDSEVPLSVDCESIKTYGPGETNDKSTHKTRLPWKSVSEKRDDGCVFL